MRPLLIGLVLLNGALLAAHVGGAAGWLGGDSPREHEPERLTRQVNAGALRVLPASAPPQAAASAASAAADSAASAALAAPATAGGTADAASAPAAAAASAPASAPASSPKLASAISQGSVGGVRAGAGPATLATRAPAAAQAERERLCLEAGPFDTPMLAAVQRMLREAGVPERAWQVLSAPAAPRHVILMGRYGDPEHLQRKTGELQRKGVSFTVLRESPDIPARLLPSLVLGRYAEVRAAESALAALRSRGVVSARVVALAPQPPGTLLRVADAGGRNLPARTAALALPGQLGWRPCPAAPTAGTAASAVTLPAPGGSRA